MIFVAKLFEKLIYLHHIGLLSIVVVPYGRSEEESFLTVDWRDDFQKEDDEYDVHDNNNFGMMRIMMKKSTEIIFSPFKEFLLSKNI